MPTTNAAIRPGVEPKPPPDVVILPTDQGLQSVAVIILSDIRRFAPKYRIKSLDPGAILVGVRQMQPHIAYQLYRTMKGGQVPQFPLGLESDIGTRLKNQLIQLLQAEMKQE